MIFSRRTGLKGVLTIPGDKSISHRSIMLGSLADGITEVHGFLNGADCISSMNCFREMGVTIDHNGDTVIIHGKGLHGLQAPKETLDVGNSGTTTRLMSGILAAQNFKSRVIGDASICRRPMKRIMTPLSLMGADIVSENGNDCAPLLITGKPLHGIHYNSPVASAQVKSCILLAGLYADGETSVTEPYVSRNHTELMFDAFGVDIKTSGTTAIVKPADKLYGQKIMIPGDISSAAYFIAAGLITPDSCITIKNVGINNTRDGILEVVKMMGGKGDSILASSKWAWVAIVIVCAWQSVAMNTIIYISGLQTVPEDVYEAGSLDGATGWKKFKNLTFPLILPFFTINMVLCMKNFLMVFDQIMALTKGGPAQSTESISFLIYNNGMAGGQFGFQSANAVVFFVVIVVISVLQMNFLGNKEEQL